ncbi:Activator of (R)-2-hydroxyglutaryl-CoA dehydratase, partial [termite gut metagenome]
ILNRMEINEACSSGCGSFIEAFARSLNYSVETFAREACLAENPCDLGTRCTVFMNSKVKQALREGASVGDIAAGLSYSVVKNCLYKVLKLKNAGELGKEIVVQGGTMRNDAVVRALELLTGTEVSRSNLPELMGAYGCALYAQQSAMGRDTQVVFLNDLLQTADYTTKQMQCRGCENRCYIHKYSFANKNVYYSGNKCEKVFSNQGA